MASSWPIKVAILLTILIPVQGAAQDWQQFGYRASGFAFDVPPEFNLQQPAAQGRGSTFEAADGAFLAVWGDDLPKEDFQGKIQAQLSSDEADGWNVTYRRITPTWASYSGIKGDKIRYFRAIAVCNDRVAVFQLDYNRNRKVPYDPIVVRMVRSLKEDGC